MLSTMFSPFCSHNCRIFLSPYTPVAPAFIIDLFKTVRTILLIGGILIVLHGVKRIVDNVLRAWARSATPKTNERDEARDRAIDSINPKEIVRV
jgi:hypothetical protein